MANSKKKVKGPTINPWANVSFHPGFGADSKFGLLVSDDFTAALTVAQRKCDFAFTECEVFYDAVTHKFIFMFSGSRGQHPTFVTSAEVLAELNATQDDCE